ncbi:MAG TPA: carboxypeptidase-like regulatory domain-containing protein [Pyrinomonadaceae bacterium]|nr:carboxypeptidase-like regulatory domain-containing protein [Pyrinomonadaceae bacterium]
MSAGPRSLAQESGESSAAGEKKTTVAAPSPATSGRDKASDEARDATGRDAVASGAITGRVLGDDGQPLAAVVIYAISRNPGATIRPPTPAMTREDGQFRIENLEPGVYNISTLAPGYVIEREPSTERPSFNHRRLGDFVTIRMIKGGVITGTVTAASGEPIVAVGVRAYRVRELDGQPLREALFSFGFDQQTDDRGVYRIYGLEPGVYVVAAGGTSQNSFGLPGAYDSDAPTFYPSATRDTASEIAVQGGQESSGIDIRYRGERGHTVSGTISIAGAQAADNFAGINITLTHVASGVFAGTAWLSGRDAERGFSFDGVGDGDYDVQARRQTRTGDVSASPVRRVSVKGADVTGLTLALAPLASVSGKLILEPMRADERTAAACAEERRNILPQEIVLNARLDDKGSTQQGQRPRPTQRAESTPNDGGDFTLRNLEGGRYRIGARPLDESWYVRAVQMPAAPAQAPAAPKGGAAARAAAPSVNTQANVTSSREALDLKTGQQLSGLSVHVAEGAASLSGRVVPNVEGAQLLHATETRLHLVPAEREAADNPLRFAETFLRADGSFAFTNLAPGRYWLLVRMPDGNEKPAALQRPVAWDADARARLRLEAEATGTAIELKPCRTTSDYTLRYPQSATK